MDSPDLRRFRHAYWRVLTDLEATRLRQWEQSRLTLPQLRVLYQIRRQPGIRTGELARALGITASTTSGLVIKLVERGLVERTTAVADRRHVPLQLTPEGAATAGELSEARRSFLDHVAAELGGDLPAITAALERLAEAAATARATEPAVEQNETAAAGVGA